MLDIIVLSKTRCSQCFVCNYMSVSEVKDILGK